MKCKICKKEISDYPCPHCEYDNSDFNNPHYLIPGCELFGGKYVVGHVIGAGGFGVTYSAWDTLLDRHVAVKEYMPGEFSTRMPGVSQITIYSGEKEKQFKDGMLKFHDESNRLAKFTEVPGIVQIYDCFYENNTAYIVMEYLEGETLEERIERDGKIPVEEAIGIMTAVLDALEVVHKEKIIHRDIAPNNIFLTKDGKVKLLDFGAARTATGSHSKSLTVLYKEGYTAEEQYRSSGDQGPWTDVYSAAATFYKSVTGITPDGAMERRLKDELKPIGKCGIKVSSQVEKAVMNALNVSAKKRTQTAGQFRQELTGEKTAKNNYVRTKENEVGRIPRPVIILTISATIIAVVILILQQFGILTFTADLVGNLFVPEGKVRMVNIVNTDEEKASTRLERLGLTMEVVELRYDNEFSPGRIISQSVDKGELIDEGTVISVVVSREAVRVPIPEVVGMNLAEAESILTEQALKWEITEINSIYPVGTVIECNPSPKTWIYQGETVSLSVSKGMESVADDDFVIPDLTGMTEEEARQMLAEHGIYLSIAGIENSDTIPEGGITSQSYTTGSELQGGSTVSVTISEGRELSTVPDVVGLSRDEAVEQLEACGLKVTVANKADMESDLNSVIGQSIESGVEVREGSEIEIYLPRRLDALNLGPINYEYTSWEYWFADAPNEKYPESGMQITANYSYDQAIYCFVVARRLTGPYEPDEICRYANANYFDSVVSYQMNGTMYDYITNSDLESMKSHKYYFLVFGVDRTGKVVAYTQYEMEL